MPEARRDSHQVLVEFPLLDEAAQEKVVVAVWRRRAWVLLWFILAGPATILSDWLFGSDVVTDVVMLVCGGMLLSGGWLLTSTRCPRCRDRLFMTSMWANAFSSRCLHCDWPVRFGS